MMASLGRARQIAGLRIEDTYRSGMHWEAVLRGK